MKLLLKVILRRLYINHANFLSCYNGAEFKLTPEIVESNWHKKVRYGRCYIVNDLHDNDNVSEFVVKYRKPPRTEPAINVKNLV